MNKRRLHGGAIILSVWLSAMTHADQIVIDSTGTVLFRVSFDDDGLISAITIDTVVMLSESSDGLKATVETIGRVPTAPAPAAIPEPPEPPPISKFEQFVADQASHVEDDSNPASTAIAIADLYDAIAGAAESGAISDVAALKKGTDAVYRSTIDRYRVRTEWHKWKQAVDAEIPQLKSLDEGIRYWREIASGLRIFEP